MIGNHFEMFTNIIKKTTHAPGRIENNFVCGKCGHYLIVTSSVIKNTKRLKLTHIESHVLSSPGPGTQVDSRESKSPFVLSHTLHACQETRPGEKLTKQAKLKLPQRWGVCLQIAAKNSAPASAIFYPVM